jgi:hypothetical protein
MISTPHHYSGDQIRKNEMGGACGTCMGDVHIRFGENRGERDHLKDLGVDGKIILKLIFKKYYGGMDTSGSG